MSNVAHHGDHQSVLVARPTKLLLVHESFQKLDAAAQVSDSGCSAPRILKYGCELSTCSMRACILPRHQYHIICGQGAVVGPRLTASETRRARARPSTSALTVSSVAGGHPEARCPVPAAKPG